MWANPGLFLVIFIRKMLISSKKFIKTFKPVESYLTRNIYCEQCLLPQVGRTSKIGLNGLELRSDLKRSAFFDNGRLVRDLGLARRIEDVELGGQRGRAPAGPILTSAGVVPSKRSSDVDLQVKFGTSLSLFTLICTLRNDDDGMSSIIPTFEVLSECFMQSRKLRAWVACIKPPPTSLLIPIFVKIYFCVFVSR